MKSLLFILKYSFDKPLDQAQRKDNVKMLVIKDFSIKYELEMCLSGFLSQIFVNPRLLASLTCLNNHLHVKMSPQCNCYMSWSTMSPH